MKIKVQRFTFFSLAILFQYAFCQGLSGQELVYEGFMGEEKVGELVVSREVNDENVKIIVQTNLSAHLLVKVAIDIYSESMYVDQSLMQASAISKVNHKVHSDVETIRLNNGYRINVNGKSTSVDNQALIGADIFYFEEPVNIDSIYSLTTGKMLDVVKGDKSHVYYFEDDGKAEYHEYQNGILQQVQIKHTLYSIVFKLKDGDE